MQITLPTELIPESLLSLPQIKLSTLSHRPSNPQDDNTVRKVLELNTPEACDHPYPLEFVRACILLKINSLAKGCCAVSEVFLNKLTQLYNSNRKICVYRSASEKQFFAQVILAIEGQISLNVEDLDDVCQANTLPVVCLVLALSQAQIYLRKQQFAFTLSFVALGGRNRAFTSIVHRDKNHPGQLQFADRIHFLATTHQIEEIGGQIKELKVQDPYSMRCAPQVHGIAYDLIHELGEKLKQIVNRPFHKYLFVQGKKVYNLCRQSDDVTLKIDKILCIWQELAAMSFLRSERILNSYLGKNTLAKTHPSLLSYLSASLERCIQFASENKLLCHLTNYDTMNIHNYQKDIFYGTSFYDRIQKMTKNAYSIICMEIIGSVAALEDKYGDGSTLWKHEEMQKQWKWLKENIGHELGQWKLFTSKLIETWTP